jgi:hypothetical protein
MYKLTESLELFMEGSIAIASAKIEKKKRTATKVLAPSELCRGGLLYLVRGILRTKC